MKRVLISAGGTSTAWGAVVSLRRNWSEQVWISVSDLNPRELVTSTLLSDHFIQCPLARDSRYSEVILASLVQNQIDAWLPLLPEEMLLAVAHRETGKLPKGVKLLLPNRGVKECSDKWEAFRILKAAAIPTPNTWLGSDRPAARALFCKPRVGTGGKGARKVAVNEAPSIGESAHERDRWIFQEECLQPEFTVDAFRSPKDGVVVATARERVEVKLGVTTKARLFTSEVVKELALQVGDAFSLEGSFCFQAMQLAGKWAVTDVNPRPGGATAMSAAVGQDYFAASFAYHWDSDWERYLPPLLGAKYVTRQYAEFVST